MADDEVPDVPAGPPGPPGSEPAPGAAPGTPAAVPGEVDAAKAALARARAGARQARTSGAGAPSSRGPSRSRGGTGRAGRPMSPDEVPRSGPAPDGRDPQRLGPSLDRLVVERGWEARSAVGALVGRWDEIVGADVAAHVRVEAYEAATGKLVLRTDSTAWATQVRLLLPSLGARLREELGDAVRELAVLGPAAPSWVKGPRTAPGRGPRDTYG